MLDAVRLVQSVDLIVQRPAVGAPIDEELLQGRKRLPGSARAGRVNLNAVARGKNDRLLGHAFRPQLLDRLRNLRLGKGESFPQFDRACAMAQPDDNDGHLKK